MKETRKVSGFTGILGGIVTGVLTGLALFMIWKMVEKSGVLGSGAPVQQSQAPGPAPMKPAPTPKAGVGGKTVGVTASARLHAWLMIHPGRSIPEINLVSADRWAALAAGVDFDSEPSVVKAVRTLRGEGRQVFGMQLAVGLARYSDANEGALPRDISALRPYLDSTCSDSMLHRYELLLQGDYEPIADSAPIIGETAGVDDEVDSVLTVSKGILTKVTADREGAEVQRAIFRFVHANEGQLPSASYALADYLTIPIADSEIRKYFNKGGIEISIKN